MKIFGEVNVLRGTVAWTRPLRLRVTPATPPQAEASTPAAPEFDEDGRLYVFRFARSTPQHYSIERDRLFEYIKHRRLPDAGQRRIRRDARNRADFIADVREIQTESVTLNPSTGHEA
jgi:hypothetical protein